MKTDISIIQNQLTILLAPETDIDEVKAKTITEYQKLNLKEHIIVLVKIVERRVTKVESDITAKESMQ